MTGNQAPSVTDTDTLFAQSVNDAQLAVRNLQTYGPHINEWPSGYRTLGFGGEGNEGAPAAALALVAAGALAVRASAGESDAATAIASYRTHVGLTLHSLTMSSALRSLRGGEGLVATLGIAANMADSRSEPNLRDVALDESALTGLLGESVQDTRAAADSGTRHGSTAANALHYADKNTLVAEARAALEAYLARYYNISIPEGHLMAYAYAALAHRSDALRKYPQDAAARFWLGALVGAGDAISDRLPDTRELRDVLHPDCFAVYNGAIDRGVTELPSGLLVTDVASRPVPHQQRTAAEATNMGVPKGLGQRSTSVMQRGPQGELDVATSYTGRRAAQETGSHNRQYLEILQTGLQVYLDCQRRMRERAAAERANRAHVIAALAGTDPQGRPRFEVVERRDGRIDRVRVPHIYHDFPFLAPNSLAHIEQAGQDLPELMREGHVAAVVHHTLNLVRTPAESRAARQELRTGTGIGVAAASLLCMDSWEAQEAYRQLIADLKVREIAANHLEANLGLLFYRGVEELPPDILRGYGLVPGQASRYQQNLPQLSEPPLHLLVMASDIVNANATSVIPLGRRVRLPSRSTAERRKTHKPTSIYDDPERNPYAKQRSRPGVIDRWRAGREQEATAYQERARRVTDITEGLRTFLELQYGQPIEDERTLGFLAECSIAEQLGFDTAPPAIQQRIAQRLYRAANRDAYEHGGPVQVNSLPPSVRSLYAKAYGIIKAQSTGRRSGLARLLDRYRREDS